LDSDQLVQNDQRLVIVPEEQVAGHLVRRGKLSYVPCFDCVPDGLWPRSLFVGKLSVDLSRGYRLAGCSEGFLDSGEADGLPPAPGSQAGPDRYAR